MRLFATVLHIPLLTLIFLLIVVQCAKGHKSSGQRTVRSPDSEQIQHWKLAFSGDLVPLLPRTLPSSGGGAVSCNWALNELCLRHVSCRELWALFRRKCFVDAQNQCRMENKNDCWQSYEGISWTGLGSCVCPGNNSDCHWIRLQTNYNKCIYELNNDVGWHAHLATAAQFNSRALQQQAAGHNHNNNNNGNGRGRAALNWTRERGENGAEWMAVHRNGHQKVGEREVEKKQRQEAEEESRRTMERQQQILREEERKKRQREEEELRRKRQREEEERKKAQEQEELRRRRVEEEARRMRKLAQEQEERTRKANEAEEQRKKEAQQAKNEMEERRRMEKAEEEMRLKRRQEEEKRTAQERQRNRVMVGQGEHRGRATNATASSTRNSNNVSLFSPSSSWTSRSSSTTTMAPSTTTTTTLKTKTATPAAETTNMVAIEGAGSTLYYTVEHTPRAQGKASAAEEEGATRTRVTAPSGISSSTAAPQQAAEPTKESRPLLTQMEGPPTENGTAKAMPSAPGGSCGAVLALCERDEPCKWHLSELQIKCPADEQQCAPAAAPVPLQRPVQCAQAMDRLVRFVQRPLVEALLFCECADDDDANCAQGATTLPALRPAPKKCGKTAPQNGSAKKRKGPRWTCAQTTRMCRSETDCNNRLSALLAACPLSADSNECALSSAADDLAKCRAALSAARGSWLDEPCHCSNGDKHECEKMAQELWPKHPCIAPVRRDFNAMLANGQLLLETSTRHPSTAFIKFRARDEQQRDTGGGRSVDEDWRRQLGEEVTLLPDEEATRRATGKARGRTRVAEKGKKGTTTTTSTTTTQSPIGVESDEDGKEEEKEEGEEGKKLLIARKENGGAEKRKETEVYEWAQEEEESQANGTKKLEKEEKRANDTMWEEKGHGRLGEENAVKTGTKMEPKKAQSKNGTFTSASQEVGEFVTQKPPSEGDGCQTRNVDGEWISHYQQSVFRQYHDWAGRCSSWCECLENGTLECHQLGCMADMLCEARHTTIVFGQRLYLEDRGACQCHDGRFICDTSELMPDLAPGLYITLGYSKPELDLMREKVPKEMLERAGLISQSSSLPKDLATRLQFALERVLPKETRCRVAVQEHFPKESVVLMQLQWFGVEPSDGNQTTRAKWHSGKWEKLCAPYVRELELNFLLERAARYQLLLSTIKQIRVIDLLDGLPQTVASTAAFPSPVPSMLILLAATTLCYPIFHAGPLAQSNSKQHPK